MALEHSWNTREKMGAGVEMTPLFDIHLLLESQACRQIFSDEHIRSTAGGLER